jgi:hypothetical protein
MPEDKLGLFRRLVIDRYERRIVARRDYVILVYTDAEAVFGHDRATVAWLQLALLKRRGRLNFTSWMSVDKRAADEAQELWERIGIGSWPSLQPPADRRKWQGAPPKLHRKGTPFIPRAELAKEAKLQERAF